MTVPPRWYQPPRELPADFEGGTWKKLRASLPLQWWHVPNVATEIRAIGALALLFIAIVLLVFHIMLGGVDYPTIPEDELWTFFQSGDVFGIIADLVEFLLYVGCLLATVFAVLAITDKLDGFLAKKIFGTSNLGAVLDPLVDKLLMLASLFLALVLTLTWSTWLVFWVLVSVSAFLVVREVKVLKLKKAETEARADNKITSARQSGRLSMVVFCTAMTVTLLPVVGPVSSIVKSALLLLIPVFSAVSWRDYHRAYSQFLR